jgi:hypothetical protein
MSLCGPGSKREDTKDLLDQIQAARNLQAAGSLMQVPAHPENRRPEDVWPVGPEGSGEGESGTQWTPCCIASVGR